MGDGRFVQLDILNKEDKLMSQRKKKTRPRKAANMPWTFPTLSGGIMGGDGASILPIRAMEGATQERPDQDRSGKRFEMHWVIGSGWIHTHGMSDMGFPEIEVRHVPDFLAEAAADLIRHVCDYMLDTNTRIRPDETMETSPKTKFRLGRAVPLPGEEDHYAVERLQIVDVEHTCDCCGSTTSESD